MTNLLLNEDFYVHSKTETLRGKSLFSNVWNLFCTWRNVFKWLFCCCKPMAKAENTDMKTGVIYGCAAKYELLQEKNGSDGYEN